MMSLQVFLHSMCFQTLGCLPTISLARSSIFGSTNIPNLELALAGNIFFSWERYFGHMFLIILNTAKN